MSKFMDQVRELNAKRTQLFDTKTAEIIEEGVYECPLCDGDGNIEGRQCINFGNQPMNVLFTGIGDEIFHNEKFFNLSPRMAAALIAVEDVLEDIYPSYVEPGDIFTRIRKALEGNAEGAATEGKGDE